MKTFFLILVLSFLVIPNAKADKPHPIITFGTTSPMVSNTTSIGAILSTVNVRMSNNSSYTGGLSLVNNGGGVCGVTGSAPNFNITVGQSLVAGTYTCTVSATQSGSTLTSSITIKVTASNLPTPSLSFNPSSPSIYTSASVGTPLSAILVFMSDGSTFAGTIAFSGANGDGAGFCVIQSDNTHITLGIIATVGTHNCTVTAIVNGFSSTATLTVSVSAAIPSIVLGTSTLNISVSTQIGAQLSTTIVSMPDGSPFLGTLSLTGTYGSGSGFCRIQGTFPNATINLAITPTVGDHKCSVVATENGQSSSSADIDVTVSAPATPTAILTPSSKSIYISATVNTPLSTVSVTVSDGSTFTGTISLTGTNGNGGGACGLSSTTLPANIVLAKTLTANTYHCSIIAIQGSISSASADLTITVSNVIPTVSFNPSSQSLPNTSSIESSISTIITNMPDGSRFFGALSFGNPYNNGGGVCEFSGTGGSIITPNSGGSLINSWGTWTFSDTIDPGGYGTFVNLNGVRNPCGGAASFLLLYNNLIYARTGFGEWLQNFGPPNFCWHTIVSDPRTPLNSLSTGVSLSGLGGTTQHCTVIATQNGQSGANDIAISVTGASPIPTVTLTPSSTPIWTSSAINTPLSQIGITMSDGSTFTGIKSITNDASGICVISGQYVVLAKIVTAATYNCTIVATQGSQTGSAILTIVASDPTLTLVFGTPHPAVLSTVPVGFQLSAITVTVSDGSLFHGTLGFGGTYGNGSGDCALSGSAPGSYLTVGRSLSSGIHNCSVVATQ